MSEHSQLDEAGAEIRRLERLVYVPGLTRCPKCNFQLMSNILNAADGSMVADIGPQQCANGCGPMWRVTEREAANEAIDRLENLHLTLDERKVLEHLVNAWNSYVQLQTSVSDQAEFQAAIHACQRCIALLVARRADPNVWRSPA